MLNKEKLVTEYNLFKKRAQIAFKQDRIDKSLQIASYCTYVAWAYPILYNFVDTDIEILLDKIAGRIITGQANEKQSDLNPRKVVLYAGQLIDTGALTEQYLHFFIENNYEVLVIVPSLKNTKQGKNTLDLIGKTPGVELFIPGASGYLSRIRAIYNKIIDFNPGIAFLHFLPNDVTGYCVFSQITHIKRYYIVHNDHTFWLGKGCSDFFLEFRKFGYLLSNQRRGIPVEKLLVLPYYPINNNVKFRGFPFEKKEQVIGLSGANLYKYLLDPELKYFYAIKKLLKRNSNFVFCLCGYGEGADKILEIFESSDVKDRFFFLGRRDDFYSLIGNIDILFESYPLKGGLTVLFALEHNKPSIGIGSPGTASGCTEDVFELEGYQEPLTIDEFIREADLLIKDPYFRNEKVQKFSGHKFNKQDFELGLRKILGNDMECYQLQYNEVLQLDDDQYLNEYLQLPNSKIAFIREKLFALRGVLDFNERIINASNLLFNAAYPLKFKELLRLSLLAVLGK